MKQRTVQQDRAHESFILSLIDDFMDNSDVIRKIVVVEKMCHCCIVSFSAIIVIIPESVQDDAYRDEIRFHKSGLEDSFKKNNQ